MRRPAKVLAAAALALAPFALAACGSDQAEANRQLVTQQQTEIEKMQHEIEALKTAQYPSYAPGVASSGECDKSVEASATKKGGEAMTASQFSKAVGYYTDAVTACPKEAQAELNLGRAYEAMGDKVSAIEHYRKAADEPGAAVTDASEKARQALERLQASRI